MFITVLQSFFKICFSLIGDEDTDIEALPASVNFRCLVFKLVLTVTPNILFHQLKCLLTIELQCYISTVSTNCL